MALVRSMWPHAALDIVVRQTYICIYFSYMPWQVTSEAPLCSMSAPIRLAQPHEEGTRQTGALAETRVGSQKKLSHEYAGLFSAGLDSRQDGSPQNKTKTTNREDALFSLLGFLN